MRKAHANDKQKLYGTAHAKQERKYFYLHFLVFILVHLAFLFVFKPVPVAELPSGSYWLHLKDWLLSKDIGYFQNEWANSISKFWTTILIVHAIWAFSHIIFPKKKKDSDVQVIEKPPQSVESSLLDTVYPSVKTEKIIKPSHSPIESTKIKKTEKSISEGKAWLFLLCGGLLEIIWASGLKSDKIPGIVVIIAMIISFDLFIRSLKVIPISTGYAVFTGTGTIGTVFVEILWFGVAFSFLKVFLILLLAGFIIGLKATSEPVAKE